MSPDLSSVPTDLVVPPVTDGAPGRGRRVRLQFDDLRGTTIHHTLYLPPDWSDAKRHPVIVEYAGNGPYADEHGDTNSGWMADARLGWGIGGGTDFIWLNLPYVAPDHRSEQRQWWGDRAATVAYCKRAVAQACADFAGDPAAVVLAGFSRGAIACNYIGLADDNIAGLWRASITHSHYDGARLWGYPEDDPASAITRLRRLAGRPQHISHEHDVGPIRSWIESTGVNGDFTCVTIPFRNHTDGWVLRDLPERRRLRQWLARALGR